MEKEKDSLQEFYSYEFLLHRAVGLLQDYESNPENQLKTLLECSNVQFLGGLESVGRSLFGGFIVSSDPLLLALSFSVYVTIINRYGKTASLEGFGFFSQIDPETVKGWQADAKILKKGQTLTDLVNELLYIYNILYFKESNHKSIINNHNNYTVNIIKSFNYNSITASARVKELLTVVSGVIYNKLTNYRETAIKYKMLDSKQLLGAVAVANQEYGWSADRIGQEERARALTLSDLPKLSNYVNSEKLPELTETHETA